jgi:hypothetical protein
MSLYRPRKDAVAARPRRHGAQPGAGSGVVGYDSSDPTRRAAFAALMAQEFEEALQGHSLPVTDAEQATTTDDVRFTMFRSVVVLTQVGRTSS